VVCLETPSPSHRMNFVSQDTRAEDVGRVLQHFLRTEKVLKVVLEAAVFRRKYYEGVFLVELLQLPGWSRRAVPDPESSVRHAFIDKLKSLDKIPQKLYSAYKSGREKTKGGEKFEQQTMNHQLSSAETDSVQKNKGRLQIKKKRQTWGEKKYSLRNAALFLSLIRLCSFKHLQIKIGNYILIPLWFINLPLFRWKIHLRSSEIDHIRTYPSLTEYDVSAVGNRNALSVDWVAKVSKNLKASHSKLLNSWKLLYLPHALYLPDSTSHHIKTNDIATGRLPYS